jgi:hypothetical protein
MAVSMVGGAQNARRKMMQREVKKALVLNQAGKRRGAHAPPRIFLLDKAFDLIEGHPRFTPLGEML